MRKKVKYVLSVFVVWLLFTFFILLLYSIKWYHETFSAVTFASILYQLFSPMRGVSPTILTDYAEKCAEKSLLISLIFTAVFVAYIYIFNKIKLSVEIHFLPFHKKMNWKLDQGKIKILNIFFVFIPMIIYFILDWNALKEIGFQDYMRDISRKSNVYEEYYIKPDMELLTFPEEKRNLVLIYLESMETTYASVEEGGGKKDNYIPHLTQLSKQYVSFSDSDQIGGAYDCAGADFTIAALLTSSSGINYKLPLNRYTESAGKYEYFLPGLVNMGDILEEAGYRNYFVCGSGSEFAGRRDYFVQHGSYTILDKYVIGEDETFDEANRIDWGLNDRQLYEYAKHQLNIIASGEEPFNFTMLTIDTHFPEGYLCPVCEIKYPEKYANAIYCADRQAVEFVEWIQEQEWYENTTVVLVGDHTSMVADFWSDLADSYERRTYNCFVNSAAEPCSIKNRRFCAIDYFPTIMASLGVTIEGDQLGLGVNLFSDKKTLSEQLGKDEFNSQLGLYSSFYYDKFIRNK